MTDEKKLDALMREWAGVPGADYREVPSAVLLAKIADVSVAEFVSQHTMVPLRRAITWFHPETKHGCESNLPLLWSGPMHLPRDDAFFCEQCVAEDLEFHGMSYWRRVHQIPGVFWCSKHKIPLLYMKKKSAFQRPPSIFLDEALRVSPEWVEELTRNSILLRYSDVCSGLMERDRPLDVAVVSHVLKIRARTQGFQTSGPPVKRPLLSDMAIKEIGRQWLATVIPAAMNKPEGELSYQIDGACYLKKSSSTATAYALVCSLLFSSADEAINALAGMHPGDLGPRRKRKADLPIDELVNAYIQSSGDYGRAAESFDCAYLTVASRFAALGMPNFAGKKGARLFEAAFAFFVEELSWAESIEVSGVTTEEMETMVRCSAGGLGGFLRKIRFPRSSESAEERPRRLSPCEVQEMKEAMPENDIASG